ncbi:MAG: hypothetical protein HLUCCA05_10175 [Roseibaca calidilacus]|uniref:Uncharacterized protein n=1 Tax=Roseibaca calidilacus TaxID=1666912 RepID=A0A0P7YR22_9RHOB|nr:hypothetical protein [Roseibaca calidilacus]KPP92752.1 MAG: hypothetical protein HLUCCA05_10175 [Roseibaca calidilacus]CUX80175.1 hypothetical protein Ga0058931_0882 [Roseibaca calidilacus]
MSKHLIDQPRDRGSERLARFVRIARASMGPVHPELSRRPRLKAVARLPAYLRIARHAG